MKYLVTGGAGFIGSWLCERLLEKGEVVCLDNFDPYYSPQAKRKNIEPLMTHSYFELVEGSILERSGWRSLRCSSGSIWERMILLGSMMSMGD